MQYYLAPMEGLTTYLFRSTYNRYFTGFDKYFTPFIASRRINRRERDEILPEHNEGITLVPQILTNRADEFLDIARQVAAYDYGTVNLNLGCPSGTVAAKKRGAGFLSVPEELDAFLSEIYERCPVSISIKTRIGIASPDEWERLLSIYAKYPVEELIIHPRLQQEFYTGTPHLAAYEKALAQPALPLCCNGNIFSPADRDALLAAFPSVSRVMLGRGVLMDPGLLGRMKHGTSPSKETLRAFHDDLYGQYRRRMSGPAPTLFKMKELWAFLIRSFTNPDRHLKKIRKANRFPEYEAAVSALFSQEALAVR